MNAHESEWRIKNLLFALSLIPMRLGDACLFILSLVFLQREKWQLFHDGTALLVLQAREKWQLVHHDMMVPRYYKRERSGNLFIVHDGTALLQAWEKWQLVHDGTALLQVLVARWTTTLTTTTLTGPRCAANNASRIITRSAKCTTGPRRAVKDRHRESIQVKRERSGDLFMMVLDCATMYYKRERARALVVRASNL